MRAARRQALVAVAVLLLALAFAPWPSWLNAASHKPQPKSEDVAPPPPVEGGACPLGFTSMHAHLLPMGHPPVA